MVAAKPAQGGGGGDKVAPSFISIRRNAAIGDCICATAIADKLIERGMEVSFQAHPAIHPVLRRHGRLSQIGEPNGFQHINLDGAYETDPNRRTKHFSTMFMDRANQQLAPIGVNLGEPLNFTPSLIVTDAERQAVRARLSGYPHPWVFICPNSEWYRVRMVPDYVWAGATSKIQGTKFWIARHPCPPGIIDLRCSDIDQVMINLSVADLLVTVDTGPMHIAAALGVPVLALGQSSSPELHLSDQRDFITISPKLDCLNCQKNKCPLDEWNPPCQVFDPDLLAHWVNRRLRSIYSEDVSAVICIYQPQAETLNKCLEAVLPQVSEVVVSREALGIVPHGTITHPKIRHVVKQANGIGYGRNANFGARHTNGKFILFLNDDCYLYPDAVARMKEAMLPGVGIVGHLIRYVDGRIYHAGKPRGPQGFYHADHLQFIPTITQITEMENLTGTSILVRRKAYFDAKGHDEEFMFYAEDDALCMAVRRCGWKIMYTPHALAVHDNHLSTKKVAGINEIMNRSNALFARKWGWYLNRNRNNRGLGTFS